MEIAVCEVAQRGIEVAQRLLALPALQELVAQRECQLAAQVLGILIGSVFVDRGGGSAVETMRRAAETVKRDHRTLLVSPEGTRSQDGTLGPFKKGPFHLAHQAEAELVPVVVRGAHALCPRGSWTVRPGVLEVEVKPPRKPTGDAAADAASLRAAYVRWLGS